MGAKDHTIILAITFKTYYASEVWAIATHLAHSLETNSGISTKVEILDTGGSCES